MAAQGRLETPEGVGQGLGGGDGVLHHRLEALEAVGQGLEERVGRTGGADGGAGRLEVSEAGGQGLENGAQVL